jgi:hypothetical protein
MLLASSVLAKSWEAASARTKWLSLISTIFSGSHGAEPFANVAFVEARGFGAQV